MFTTYLESLKNWWTNNSADLTTFLYFISGKKLNVEYSINYIQYTLSVICLITYGDACRGNEPSRRAGM